MKRMRIAAVAGGVAIAAFGGTHPALACIGQIKVSSTTTATGTDIQVRGYGFAADLPPITFSWEGGSTIATVAPNPDGTFSITVQAPETEGSYRLLATQYENDPSPAYSTVRVTRAVPDVAAAPASPVVVPAQQTAGAWGWRRGFATARPAGTEAVVPAGAAVAAQEAAAEPEAETPALAGVDAATVAAPADAGATWAAEPPTALPQTSAVTPATVAAPVAPVAPVIAPVVRPAQATAVAHDPAVTTALVAPAPTPQSAVGPSEAAPAPEFVMPAVTNAGPAPAEASVSPSPVQDIGVVVADTGAASTGVTRDVPAWAAADSQTAAEPDTATGAGLFAGLAVAGSVAFFVWWGWRAAWLRRTLGRASAAR